MTISSQEIGYLYWLKNRINKQQKVVYSGGTFTIAKKNWLERFMERKVEPCK